MSARAIVSRRFIPPDRGSTWSFARSVSWTKSRSSSARRRASGPGDVEVAGVHQEVLEDRQLGVEVVDLGDNPEPALDPRPVTARVHPDHGQRPVADRARAGDHPHRRGLARPVGTEEAKGLPDVDVEVDAVDGGEGAEALRQAPGMDEDIGLDRHGRPVIVPMRSGRLTAAGRC
jgi:hypothetical protein